jgi:hypothetical protein
VGLAQLLRALAHALLELAVLARELLLRERQRARHLAEHPAQRIGMGGEHLVQLVLADVHGLAVAQRDHAREPAPVVEHRQLAEAVAGLERLEHHLGVRGRAHHVQQPAAHDVQLVADLALREDDLARRVAARARPGREGDEPVVRQHPQQLYRGQLLRPDGGAERLGRAHRARRLRAR